MLQNFAKIVQKIQVDVNVFTEHTWVITHTWTSIKCKASFLCIFPMMQLCFNPVMTTEEDTCQASLQDHWYFPSFPFFLSLFAEAETAGVRKTSRSHDAVSVLALRSERFAFFKKATFNPAFRGFYGYSQPGTRSASSPRRWHSGNVSVLQQEIVPLLDR